MHAQSCTCMYMWHLIVTWLFRYLDLLAVLKANPRWFVFCVFRVSGILLTEQILHQSVRTLVSPPCPQTLILTWICPSSQGGQWTEILHAKFSRRSLPNIKVRRQGGKDKTKQDQNRNKMMQDFFRQPTRPSICKVIRLCLFCVADRELSLEMWTTVRHALLTNKKHMLVSSGGDL